MASKIILGLTIIVLASFGVYKLLSLPKQSTTPPTTPSSDSPTIHGQSITVSGEVICLPSKNNKSIQTMGCAIGLKTDDGTYWGLNNVQNDLVNAKFGSGDLIEVTGTQNNGVIEVTSTKVIKKGTTPVLGASTTIQELPLHYSATHLTKQTGNNWDTWYFSPTINPTGAFNYVGLKGNLTLTYAGHNDATVLIYLLVEWSGNCPPTGRYYKPSQNPPWLYSFPSAVLLSSFILRTAQPGTITIPTDFILPYKVPVSGCISLMMNGGEINQGDPVITSSNLTLLYDTDPPLKPTLSTNSFASEICIGRDSGCEKVAPSSTPDQAFARYQRIKAKQTLVSWIGNTNSAASRAGAASAICPPGAWDSTSDYYIYKATSCPTTASNPIVYTGPSISASQIPANAIKLYSSTVHGNQCNGGQSLINQTFTPPIAMQEGDCMVQIQKFNTPSGVVTQETQSVFITQEDNVKGDFGNASCSSFVGWVGNMTSPNTPIDVHFYADGVGPTHMIGKTTANVTREKAVCDALGFTESPCNHGFTFNTPNALKDGKPHVIDAYAINGSDNPKLTGSGKTITCSATKPGDLNADGRVDIFDYNLLVQNFDNPYTIFDYNTLVENYEK